MKSFAIWSLLGFVVLSIWTGNGVVAAICAPLSWFVAAQVYPYRPCTGKCKGKGKLGDPADKTYWGNCPDCGGSGRQLRWFAFKRFIR